MFDSLFGGIVFLQFLFLGFVCGIFYEVCKLCARFTKNNIFIVNTVKFVYYCMVGVLFCSFIFKYCSGQVQFYTFFACLLGIIIEQISIGFFFTKFYNLVYNIFTKVLDKAKNTKLGNKILR